MQEVLTSSDSARQGLSNDMRHVPSFWIFNEIRKIGCIRRWDGKVMTSSESSRRGLSNDMRHEPPFWIFNEIQKKNGKWWCHRTQLGEGFRMTCVTCRHFEYLMRYDKSATSGRSMSKVMTSSESSLRGLSNDMRHVPPF